MQPLRLGSLFSGVGGLDMAVEEFFGAETAWHCQYDPDDKHQYAAQVLARHWPRVPNHGDITAVDWDQVEPIDILAGGFPCQDISLAGRMAGLTAGTRSGLWAHMARAIKELRPRLVVVENTRGLLSARADSDVEPCAWCVGDADGEPCLRALGAVLADLAELGFDAEWVGLPASDVGAAHERFRVFVLAWPALADAARLGHGDAWSSRVGGLPAAAVAGSAAAPADTDGKLVRNEPVAEPQRGSSALAQLAGTRPAADTEGNGWGEGRPESARLGGGSDAAVGGAPDWGVYEPAIARWEHVAGRPAPRPVDDRGRLSPALPEWMMGLPAGWLTVDPAPAGMTPSQVRNAQLKAAGNGVVPQQAYAAFGLLWERATADLPARTAA